MSEEMRIHYYRTDGSAVYDAGIKEARAEGYLYGVTSIIRMWPKAALDKWKVQEAIRKSFDIRPIKNEPQDAYIRRVQSSMEGDLDDAADAGTAVHECVEGFIMNNMERPDVPDDVWVLAQQTCDWLKENIAEVLVFEKPLPNPSEGYSGTPDIGFINKKGWLVFADFKTREPKKNAKGKKQVYWYETQPMQLIAYMRAFLYLNPKYYTLPRRITSIVIDRSEPDKPFVKDWAQGSYERYWKDFCACREMLFRYKNYYPAPKKTKHEAEQFCLPLDTEPAESTVEPMEG